MCQLIIHTDRPGGTINRNIYGHFAEHLGRCIYEGIWVGEDSRIPNTRGIRRDVVAALRKLDVPVLRWPGGCFADEYHWKDGIGLKERRPRMINTHWGGTVENNHFGTHEFFDLCEQLGCEAYINGNVGSGTPQEMMEWVEYMTSDTDSFMANLRRQNGREKPWKLAYFGVGNESWGCGGSMRPEYYADEFRRYNTFVKNYSGQVVERIACGANGEDYKWTEVLMERVGDRMNGLSMHYYTLPRDGWANKGAATGFDEAEWHTTLFKTLRMDEIVRKHSAIMDKYDPEKKIGMIIDEWGTWYDAERGAIPGWLYQQNSVRDALVAAINLHIFHAHSERVTMTNIAQTINVLQAMILTHKDRIILTPSYHVFEMLKVHQDATFIPVELTSPDYELGGNCIPSVHASASRNQDGRLHLSLANLQAQVEAKVNVEVSEARFGAVTGRVLTGRAIDAVNTFEEPYTVAPAPFTNFRAEADRLSLKLPARSVTVLRIG